MRPSCYSQPSSSTGSGRCSARSSAIASATIASTLSLRFALSILQPRPECLAIAAAACWRSSSSSGSVSRFSTRRRKKRRFDRAHVLTAVGNLSDEEAALERYREGFEAFEETGDESRRLEHGGFRHARDTAHTLRVPPETRPVNALGLARTGARTGAHKAETASLSGAG